MSKKIHKNNSHENKGRVVRLDVKVEQKKRKKNNQQKEVKKTKAQEFIPAEEIIRQAKIKHTHKLFVMWSGVTFFMLLIVAAWVFNIQNVFSASTRKVSVDNGFEFSEFKNITEDLGEQIGELKKVFDETEQASSTKIQQGDHGTSTAEAINPLPDNDDNVSVKGISTEDIELLKEKLLEISQEK